MSVTELEKSKEKSTAYVLETVGYEDGPSDRLLALRKDFIGRIKHWRDYADGETDLDRYDEDPTTAHVTSTDPSGNIVASLRLTKTTVEDSLSWSMLSDEAKIAAEDSGLLPPNGRRIMDMTRLVVDMDASAEDRKRELARILGEAVKKLCDKDTTWIFSLDVGFARFLRIMGVPFKEIVIGSSSSEKGESVIFGSIEPVSQIKDVKSSFGEIALEQTVVRS